MTDSEESQQEWTSVLCQWNELKRFFGPDRKSSLMLFNQLQAKLHAGPAMNPALTEGQSTATANATANVNTDRKVSEPKMLKVSRSRTNAAALLQGTTDAPAVREMEIRVALRDGTIQPLIVDANVEIYDLVYAVAGEIGEYQTVAGYLLRQPFI